MMVALFQKPIEFAARELLDYVFERMVQPAMREAVRRSGVPSAKVRCDMCRGPFPLHVHVCDECSVRMLKPAVLRRLVRVFGKQIYVAVVNVEMVEETK